MLAHTAPRPTRIWERAFVVVAVYLLSGAATSFSQSPADQFADALEGSGLQRVLFSGVYAMALLLIFSRMHRSWATARRDGWLAGLVGLALLSAAWSVLPDMTMRRSVALLGTTLFGVYLAMQYSSEEQLALVGAGLALGALLSAVVAVVWPAFGVASVDVAAGWQGVYSHKNALGKIMALASLVFGLLASRRGAGRALALGGLGLSVMLVVESRSMSAVVVLLCLALMARIFRVLGWRLEILVPAVLVVMLVVMGATGWATSNSDALLKLMGRDVTLSGRTDLWEVVLEAIGKHPWLGYGYSSFWRYEFLDGDYISRLLGWAPPHAHNGLLELALDLGVCGVIVFLIGFGRSFARALAGLRFDTSPAGLWPILYLTFVLLYNLSESTILARNSLFWALYVAAALAVADPARRRVPAAEGERRASPYPRSRVRMREATRARRE
jgi:O-antigen ligase